MLVEDPLVIFQLLRGLVELGAGQLLVRFHDTAQLSILFSRGTFQLFERLLATVNVVLLQLKLQRDLLVDLLAGPCLEVCKLGLEGRGVLVRSNEILCILLDAVARVLEDVIELAAFARPDQIRDEQMLLVDGPDLVIELLAVLAYLLK